MMILGRPGELDHDVPMGQSEEYFIALQKLNVESSLVRYVFNAVCCAYTRTCRRLLDLSLIAGTRVSRMASPSPST